MSLLSFTAMQADHHNEKNALSFKMKSIEDKEVSLKEWKGKVLLMVNVASKVATRLNMRGCRNCTMSSRMRGLRVVGFPATILAVRSLAPTLKS